MAYKATPEQHAAALERRAAMRKLAKQISDMVPAQRAELAARFPVVTIEGRALSVFNSCLVATQSPNATVVGGFRQWIKAGRGVRKGEHGMAIWVPLKPREVVKKALQHNAAAMIFAHNHPSGIAEPSRSDESLTLALKQALALVDVKVLDHFIVGQAAAMSFAERGLL